MREREGKGSNHEIVCVDSVIIFVPPPFLLETWAKKGINFEKSLIKTSLPPSHFWPTPFLDIVISCLLFPPRHSPAALFDKLTAIVGFHFQSADFFSSPLCTWSWWGRRDRAKKTVSLPLPPVLKDLKSHYPIKYLPVNSVGGGEEEERRRRRRRANTPDER